MRILILNDRIPPENRGGAGRVVWMLAGGLRDIGHEVHVVAATPDAPFEEVRDGIPTYHLHSRYPARFQAFLSLYNPQTTRPLRDLMTRLRPDMVNAHNIHTDLSYYGLSLAWRKGIPTVFNSHDVMPFAYAKLSHFIDPAYPGVRSPAQYRLPRFYNLKQMRFRYNPVRNAVIRRILTHHAGMRVAVSEAHRQALEANGLPPFRVVYNGLDPDAFAASELTVERMRTRLGLEGRRVILFAGRLTREKGGVQLVRALNRLVERMPDLLLLLLSSHPPDKAGLDEPEFHDFTAHHLRSGGWLEGEELAAVYQLADVVTVPSIIMDSFPTVNIEAMAAAKPVIATCYGGSPEAVIDGVTGYIVNPFDTDAFADRLERLLCDENLRRRMGMAGRERLLAKFTLAGQINHMIGVYNDATGLRYNT